MRPLPLIDVDGPLRRPGLGHHHRGARHRRTGAGPAAAGGPLAWFDDDFGLFPTPAGGPRAGPAAHCGLSPPARRASP
ncbi:hypothetical protein K7G98_25530 [Saccharothrix sp. MB29]|nr:hypothetical protein [Saccharothrix sp. MB29]